MVDQRVRPIHKTDQRITTLMIIRMD